ncbi:MAG: hypothetical protein ACI32E_01145 [Bacilli bacterium]
MNLILGNVELFPLFIALFVMIIPIFILLIIVLIKFIAKNINRKKSVKESNEDIINKYLAPFGEDNIVSLSVNMRRVNVEVKDINKINIEGLKNLGVGILISGNIVKCSSIEFAQAVEEKQ